MVITALLIHIFIERLIFYWNEIHNAMLIIRDEKSYLAISNFIINNPANWKDDEYYR